MNFSLDRRAHSETGPLRKNNQDSGFSSPNLLVVADGMGGAAAGDLASTVAISLVERVDERHTGEDMLSVLAGAVSRANDKLADLVAADHALDGMGTTVTGAMFSGTQLGFVHIGDSRAYVLRDGELDRITTDHSWVMSLVAEGKITEAEAETHPHRNLLLKVLNGQPTHQPDTFLFDVQAGDRLLLCSDGLCGFASDKTIATHLAKPDLDEAMDGLVKAAYAGGGGDNITIVLADVVEQDDKLDAGTPAVIGAALTTEIPEVPEAGVDLGDDEDDEPEDETRIPRAPAPVVIDPETMESLRYAPTLVKRRRWIAPVVSTLLILAALVGIPAGFLLGRFTFVSRMFSPIIALLRPVSPLAWLPIGLLLFQRAEPASSWTIFICSIWPMVINTAEGVQRIPQDYLNVARVLQLSEWTVMRRILFPAVLPAVLTGVRLSIGIAWLVIVAAEMLTGGLGIGFWIWNEWNNLNVENILIAILIIGVVGLLLEQGLMLLARRFSWDK